MEHDHRYSHDIPFVPHQGHWHEAPGYHPHHHSPQTGYHFQSFSPGSGSYDHQHTELSPRQEQYQSFAYPTYPSMLAAPQSSYVAYHHPHPSQIPLPAPPQASAPASGPGLTPTSTAEASAYSTKTETQPVQRKMLSDADRRKMCEYHAENPTKKQTEIGEIFGVERSTVSKVLRQKERYLVPEEDGRKSPVKKPKSKFHELERALANWARKQEKEGFELTDDMIKDRATCFSQVARNGAAMRESINDPSWLKEFKSRNKVGLSRSRKSSVLKKESPTPVPAIVIPESKETSTAMSPPSVSSWVSPTTTDVFVSGESPRIVNSAMLNGRSTVYHSQSNNSLSSAYGGTAASSTTYSSMNTNSNSPVRTPDTMHAEPMQSSNSYFPGGQHQPKYPSASMLTESPTSETVQTSSLLSSRPEPRHWSSVYDQIPSSQLNSNQNDAGMVSHHGLSHTPTPSIHAQPSNSSLASHGSGPLVTSRKGSQDEDRPYGSSQINESYHTAPPVHYDSLTQGSSPRTNIQAPRSPSKNEAYAALDTVINYLHNQPENGGIERQDMDTINKLSQKLKFTHRA